MTNHSEPWTRQDPREPTEATGRITGGKTMTLAEMRAERDRLGAAIAAAEEAARKSWNNALADCEHELEDWLRGHSIEVGESERKGVKTWDCGHGALTVTFEYDDGRGRVFQMLSGGSLRLEWLEVPEPDRMLDVVAALLGVAR